MRQILYVDGFNFYYGVTAHWRAKSASLAGLGWCDFGALVRRHFSSEGDLAIKYFTAPVTESTSCRSEEYKRFDNWIRAIRTVESLTVIRGFHKRDDQKNPDSRFKKRQEKQTDVNLAIEIVADAMESGSERAEQIFVLSGDTDVMPAVFMVAERIPDPIRVTILLPSVANKGQWDADYARTRHVLQECHGIKGRPFRSGYSPNSCLLDESTLANSLLHYELCDARGKISCPEYWRLSDDYLQKHCEHANWPLERRSYYAPLRTPTTQPYR